MSRSLPTLSAVDEIAAERQRQISVEGWAPEHDDQHRKQELAMAAAVYAAPEDLNRTVKNAGRDAWKDPWPWLEFNYTHRYEGVVMDRVGFKEDADRRRKLVIAGALIVAEIERLDRASTIIGDQGEAK